MGNTLVDGFRGLGLAGVLNAVCSIRCCRTGFRQNGYYYGIVLFSGARVTHQKSQLSGNVDTLLS